MQPDRKHGSASQKVDADREEYFKALQGGDINFVTVFLCKHPDAAHWNTPDGTPPLVLAVGSNERDRWLPDSSNYRHDQVMELLISYGADINAKDREGKSPLLEECEHGNRDAVIQMLIKNGADVNAGDNLGKTPLHVVAARDWGEDQITAFVAAGAKVDVQDWQGNTPLHVAAGEGPFGFTHGHQDSVRRLISAGASLDIKNAQQRTPFESASMNEDFQQDGKRPTAEIIESVLKARPQPKPPKKAPEPKSDGTGSKERDPRLPVPAKDKFKLKPPAP